MIALRDAAGHSKYKTPPRQLVRFSITTGRMLLAVPKLIHLSAPGCGDKGAVKFARSARILISVFERAVALPPGTPVVVSSDAAAGGGCHISSVVVHPSWLGGVDKTALRELCKEFGIPTTPAARGAAWDRAGACNARPPEPAVLAPAGLCPRLETETPPRRQWQRPTGGGRRCGPRGRAPAMARAGPALPAQRCAPHRSNANAGVCAAHCSIVPRRRYWAGGVRVAKGVVMGVYRGVVTTTDEDADDEKTLHHCYATGCTYWQGMMPCNQCLFVDASVGGDWTSVVQHGDDNFEFGAGWPPVLIAKQDIKDGDELFIDYGKRFWEDREPAA